MNRNLLAFTVVLILLVAGTSADLQPPNCPKHTTVECNNILSWCLVDKQCKPNNLCCPNKCGLHSCVKPVRVSHIVPFSDEDKEDKEDKEVTAITPLIDSLIEIIRKVSQFSVTN